MEYIYIFFFHSDQGFRHIIYLKQNGKCAGFFWGGVDHANVLNYIPGALLVGRQASTKGGVS